MYKFYQILTNYGQKWNSPKKSKKFDKIEKIFIQILFNKNLEIC